MFISRLKNSVSLFAILAAATAPHNAGAQMVAANDAAQAQSNVFDLGEIEQVTITASPFSQAISRSVVTGEETFKFNALTLDRAVDLAAGVQSGSTGGPRNERLFFVRGFDRFQSPLYVDGIRVYLPADNRVDLVALSGLGPCPHLPAVQLIPRLGTSSHRTRHRQRKARTSLHAFELGMPQFIQ